MTELSGTRVQALFDRAVELPAAERAAFLEASCAGDPALRAEVESLLATDEQLGDLDLLASPLVRAADPSSGAPWPRIGCYRIVRPIAEGGMGAVYEAEQDNPRRRVALKVVRPGLASPVLLKRFALEAQILGRLQHPGIAQVYEAGVSDNGQPFFAMQFVSGRSLIEYAHAKSLSLSARLELMAKTCDAVQYAHDQGVIHRDLKPANILVDDTGQPKVLDFGLARVTGNNLLNGDGLTHSGQLFGTPNYMSPEQASADFAAIDHRADVYALGVILFELLAHRLPYRLEGHPLAEATRILLEEEPPRLGSFDPALRGDLDTAVAKALEKDPRRRYPSAAELAADLRRFLAHEPILARSPSASYRLSKFARRNKVLVGGFVTTAAALVLGLLGTIHFAVGEARQRDRAVAEKEEAEFQAYRARIAAAIAALTAHDVVDAGRQLDEAPEELRGWEWRHLRSRLDDSSSAVALPVPEGTFLNGAPGPATVCELTSAGLRLTDLEGGSTRTVPIGREHGWHVVARETSLGLRVARWIDKTTLVLEDESGRRLGEVQVPAAQQPEPIALSPDGTRLATHWADGQWRRIGVFDATSGESVAVCQGHLAGIWSLTFSPDGTRLASSGEDLAARLWDPSTGALTASCEGHRRKVLSVAFRSDGARLVTASSDGAVRQWDAATGREAEPSYDRHSGEVAAAVYSPDGRLVASAGTDRTIRLWQATGREDVAILHGHTGPVTRLAFSASGRRLASLSLTWIFASGDDTLRTWDTESLANSLVLRGHTQSVSAVAYSPDGRWLASGGWDGAVRVWRSATGEPRATLTHPGVVPWLAFASDRQRLVSVNYGDERVRIWDLATAEVKQEIQGPVGKLQSVHLSPKGMQAAATIFDQEKHHFEITEIETGKLLFASEGKALAYSPNGKWLAILPSDEKTIALLDARTHAPVVHFRGHEQAVLGALFSPDSRRLASFGRDQTVRLWRLDDGECQVLRGHTDEVFCGAFHPDGTRLATGGRDRAIWMWDLARGDDVARLLGHTSYVSSLAFSPDGATLASGSGDAAVRLWSTVPLKSRDKLEGEASVEGSSSTSAPGNSPADENQM